MFEKNESGLLVPEGKVTVGGIFDIWVNGELVEQIPNLVVTEGLNYILDVALSGGSQEAAFYVTAFKNAVSPAANWTAATFAATAGEISLADVVEANRQVWTDGGVVAGVVDNYASKAEYTVEAATLDLNGVALISSIGIAATTGKLIAASAFGATRSLVVDDVIGIGYRFTITSA